MKLFANKAKSLLLVGTLMSAMTSMAVQADVRLNGSGASFPAPIYAKWFKDYSDATDGVRVDYQSKGSGGGISDLINEIVDFAGSDAAMTDEEIAQVKKGVVLLPVTAGEVVLTYNLSDISELKLPRDVYPEIFLGNITRWNDPKIQAANPGITLPDQRITVVVRSDSSGTSFVFSNHLSAIHNGFKETVGGATAPNWPNASTFVRAPKNDGIAATVRQTPGAIGYVEYGFAKLTNLPTVVLENQKGNFIPAGSEGGSEALASTPFPDKTLPDSNVPDLRGWVTDPPGDNAYPIATYTWLLVYKNTGEEKAAAVRDLIEYMVTTGQESAESMGYIPLPENVIEKVRNAASFIQ